MGSAENRLEAMGIELPGVFPAAGRYLGAKRHRDAEVEAHARSAIGVAELPFDICVEIEMVVAVGD
jgi:enamine deaminase RidA (YjgF/YER057c/UK114 family)